MQPKRPTPINIYGRTQVIRKTGNQRRGRRFSLKKNNLDPDSPRSVIGSKRSRNRRNSIRRDSNTLWSGESTRSTRSNRSERGGNVRKRFRTQPKIISVEPKIISLISVRERFNKGLYFILY